MIFWGGTFTAGRLLSQNMSSYSAAFLRFLVATLCLAAYASFKNPTLFKIKRKHIVPLILLGITGIAAYNIFFFKGLRLIEANRASIIIASCPVFIALFSGLFLKEKITWFKLTGILISFTGVSIVITDGSVSSVLKGSLGRGELFIFICVLCWAAYTLIGKKILTDISPFTAVLYSSFFGMLLLMPFAILGDLHAAMKTASIVNGFEIIYLGFFGTVLGFIWYYKGVHKIGSTQAGIFINLVPVNAVWIAALLLKEPVSLSLLIGGVFVILGVYLANNL